MLPFRNKFIKWTLILAIHLHMFSFVWEFGKPQIIAHLGFRKPVWWLIMARARLKLVHWVRPTLHLEIHFPSCSKIVSRSPTKTHGVYQDYKRKVGEKIKKWKNEEYCESTACKNPPIYWTYLWECCSLQLTTYVISFFLISIFSPCFTSLKLKLLL